MHTWKASVQFNGEEETMYSTVYFKISNKLYQKMTSATKCHKAFTDCDFYDELNKKAEKAAEKYLDDISDHIEKPARKNYDSYVELKNMYHERHDNDHPSFIVYVEAVNEIYQKIKGGKRK